MALFDQQDIAAPQGSVAPTQAVAPVSNNTAGAVIGGITQLAQVGAQLWAQNTAKEQKAKQATAVTQYAQNITALNEGVSQGKFSQAEAQRRQRVLFNQAIANNPTLTEDFVSLNTKLAGSAGLGDTLAQGTAVEQQYQADLKKATGSGWIHEGMTASQQEDAVEHMRQQEHAAQQMDFYSKQLSIQNQKLGLQEKRANIANAQAQRANAVMEAKMKANQLQVRNGLNGAVQAEYDRQRSQIESIQKNSVMTPEQKAMAVQKLQQDFNSQLMQYRGIAGSDYVDGLTKPFADMYKAGQDYVSGKTSADIYQHQLDSAQTKALLPFAADPQMAADLAATKLLGSNTPPSVMSRLSNNLASRMAEIQKGSGVTYNPTSPSAGDKADTKTHVDILKSTIDQLDQKSPLIRPEDKAGVEAELHKNVNAILGGTVDFASSQKTPNQMNNVMDFIASPQFLKYMKNGGTIDENVSANIENVIGTNYTDKLAPVIQQAWKDAQVTTGFSVDTGAKSNLNVGFANVQEQQAGLDSALEYTFRNGSLTFRPKKGYEGNPAVIAKAKDLNQQISPLVNKTVRAAAHLQGNDDFDSAFKKYETEFFGEHNVQPVAPSGGESVNGR